MISLWFGTRFEASAKRKMGVGRFMILFQLATCTFHWSSKKRVVTWTRFSQGKVLNPIWGSWDRRDGLHDPQRINEFDVLTLGWLREMWKPKFFSVRWSFAKAWSHPHADLHLSDERQLDRCLNFLSIDVLHVNLLIWNHIFFLYLYNPMYIYNIIIRWFIARCLVLKSWDSPPKSPETTTRWCLRCFHAPWMSTRIRFVSDTIQTLVGWLVGCFCRFFLLRSLL